MNLCETCKYWNKDTEYEHGENWGICGRPDAGDSPVTASTDDLWTIADRFGCTEHKPRAAEKRGAWMESVVKLGEETAWTLAKRPDAEENAYTKLTGRTWTGTGVARDDA